MKNFAKKPKMNSLNAGISKVNITPPVGIYQIGFSCRLDKPSIGIHDDLYAAALVLKKNEEKTAIITTDTLGYTDITSLDKIRKLVKEQTGIEHILLCGSHTHCGPIIGPGFHRMIPEVGEINMKGDPAYTDIFCRKIAGAVYMAANEMVPVRVKSGIGRAKIGINRRPLGENGKVKDIGENPYGPIDDSVSVFAMERKDGTTLAFLVNYACHAVSAGASFYISADYPGYTQKFIENKLGCVALFAQGACANVNPKKFTSATSSGSFELAEKCGTELGRMALTSYKKIDTYEDIHDVRVTNKKIFIPLRQKLPTKTGELLLEFFEERNISRINKGKLSYEIYIMKVGSSIFVGLEGEPFVEIGLEIKKEILSKYKEIKQIFIIGYSGCTGYYIPTVNAFEEGGYECEEAILTENASNIIVKSVLETVDHIMI